MKSLKFAFILVAFLATSFAVSSCGNKAKTTTQTEEATTEGKEYTSAYICPMHCEGSGSDKAGNCPVCGMDYVMKEEKDTENHDGHDHGDHDGHDH